VTEQAAKLKTAADEAHKATTKIETMNKRLTELEQLCSKRWKETKANFRARRCPRSMRGQNRVIRG